MTEGIRTVNMLGCHDGIPLLDLRGLLDEDGIERLIETVKGVCGVSFVDRRAQRPRSVVAGGEPRRDRLDIELPFGGGHDQLEDCVIVQVHGVAVEHRFTV